MLKNPAQKYQPFQPIQLRDRTWPDQTIMQAPIWLSTDLRDGNQALAQPMNLAQKLKMFQLLTRIGFKEIEIGFPSASQTEFEFTRQLIEQRLIPDDVTIQVLTPARDELIRKTFCALKGVSKAIIHVYNATAPVFRQVVFDKSPQQTIDLGTDAAQLIRDLAELQPETKWQFQYSPEVFTSTELEFARDICNAVLEVWKPTVAQKAIINLPASVEVSSPNGFADQVEWMHRHLIPRESVILCVHTHNDRGCSVAASELALLAGAQRVEGCLFGNGERTGNVDLVTLAMNLYSQGINPGLDFSRIDQVAAMVKECTQLPIHPRHPYVGELVYTAFSGSHLDAIRKGFSAHDPAGLWQIPYLPMDPADVGRSYESVVRVNSQSGKGGIAFLMERDYGIVLPRSLQIEFSRVVQKAMDQRGAELSSADVWQIFQETYLGTGAYSYCSHRMSERDNSWDIEASLTFENQPIRIHGSGTGPIDAFINALGLDSIGPSFEVQHYEERSLQNGNDAQAIAIILLGNGECTAHGVGIHSNIVTASFLAVLGAINRIVQSRPQCVGKCSASIKSS